MEQWLNTDEQVWRKVFSKERWEFAVSLQLDPIELQKRLEDSINIRFTAVTDFRSKLVDWSFRIADHHSNDQYEEVLQQVARRVFDGMRILPYKNKDIAKAISVSVALYLLWYCSGKEKHEANWVEVFKPYFKDGFGVEFGSPMVLELGESRPMQTY